MKTLQEIHSILQEIQQRRPLNAGEKRELQKSLLVEFTYNSNAIEGSTITRGETKILLEDGLTIGGKTIREMNETLNHKKCFEFLFRFISEKQELDEKTLYILHQYILENIDNENAGKYRSIQVFISGDNAIPPAPKKIKNEMEKLFQWYNENKNTMNIVDFAGEFHYRLVKIHPFIDGNGRLARLCVNCILMQKGFPMIIIPVVRRLEYISSLHSSASKQLFLSFFRDIVLVNIKDYLRMISE